MKSKKLKRLLAVFAAVAMVMTLVTVPVSAEADTWDGTSDTSWYNAGETEFTLSTAEDLAGLATLVNNGTTTFSGKTVKLDADIDLTGYDWTPIGLTTSNSGTTVFSGSFDGQNHTISNMTINYTTKYYAVGLFGWVKSGGTIQNLTVDGTVTDTQSTFVGGIIGRYAGAVGSRLYNLTNNCTVTASAASYCGGISGSIESNNVGDETTIMANLTNNGSVTNSSTGDYTGGIAGYWSCRGYADNLLNSGTVTASTKIIAGLIAYISRSCNKMTNLTNTGNVTGTGTAPLFVAGLIGDVTTSQQTMANLTNSGNIAITGTSNGDVAGLIGRASNKAINIASNSGNILSTRHGGGLIGQANTVTIEQAANTGTVTCSNLTAGGLVGYANKVTLTDVYSTGGIEGTGETTYVGGLCGSVIYSTITNSYSYGDVEGIGEYVGGIAGSLGKLGTATDTSLITISNSFYLSENGTTAAYGYVYEDDEGGKPITDESENAVAATEEEFASGEVLYALQRASDAWGQLIGTNNTPIFTDDESSSSTIYAARFYQIADVEGEYVDTVGVYQIYRYTNDNDQIRYYSRKIKNDKVTYYYDDEYYTEANGYILDDINNDYETIYGTSIEYNYFDGNPMEIYSTSYAVEDEAFATPATAPTKEGYTFKYWVTADGTEYDFSTPATEDITLYPVFEEESNEPTPTPTPTPAATYFKTYSVTLGGKIGVNFYIDLNGLDKDNAVVEMTWNRGNTTVNLKNATPETDGTYMVSCRVAAKEINDQVTAVLKVDGEEIATYSHSVSDYAYAVLNLTEGYNNLEKLQEVARAILIYGAKAQNVFGYNTGDLADKNLGDYTLTEPTLTPISYSGYNFAPYGLTIDSTSLVLVAETTYRLYFRVDDEDTFLNTTVTLNGKNLSCTTEEAATETKGRLIYYDIANIAAKNITEDVTLTFANGGTEEALTFNPSAYISGALSYGGAELKAAVSAIYRYNQAAKTYFGN